MKKSWLEDAVDKVTSRVAKKAGDLAADQAKKQAAARVEDLKTSAKEALGKVEEALFGPDSEAPESPATTAEKAREARRRAAATPAETPSARAKAAPSGGALKRAREDADRRAEVRVEAEAAKARADQRAIDDELAAMKKRLGKK